jgi:hypothetical protein
MFLGWSRACNNPSELSENRAVSAEGRDREILYDLGVFRLSMVFSDLP